MAKRRNRRHFKSNPAPTEAVAVETTEASVETSELESEPMTTDDTPETETSSEAPVEASERSDEELDPAVVVDHLRHDYALPEEWDEATVQRWASYVGETPEPVRTTADILVYDPTRSDRHARDWENGELIAYLADEIQGVAHRRQDEIINEYCRREHIDLAWTNQQLLDYVRHGVEPPKTRSGAWVIDRTRQQRDVSEWSLEELEAWAQGEIQATGKAPETKLAGELRRRLKLTTYDTSVEGILQQYELYRNPPNAAAAEALRQATSDEPFAGVLSDMSAEHIDHAMNRYIEAVKPGQMITDATGGQAQRQLDALFAYVLKQDGQALLAGLDRMKQIITRHREDVFSPSNAHRFTHLIKGDRKHQQMHVNLIELFLIVTDQNTLRRKQVDMRHMVSGFPPSVADRLVDYFTNYA